MRKRKNMVFMRGFGTKNECSTDPMFCLVTGATGCLGMNLTKRLIDEGHQVLALGRNLQLGQQLTKMGAQFVVIELHDKEALKRVAAPVDLVFHCAALSSPWGKYKDFYNANVLGTQYILDATPAHVRFIHVSSPSIYFDFTEKHNIYEKDPLPLQPVNNYVRTKLMAEALVDKACVERQLATITLRPRALFGPYDRAIIPRLLRAEKNGVLPLIGTGSNLIDMTYVDNVVEGLILASKAPECFVGNKYNITNDEPRTLTDIISSLFKALQREIRYKYIPWRVAKPVARCLEYLYRFSEKEPRLTAYTAGVLALGQTLNIDAIKKDLGYRPLVTIDEGLQRFALWYQSQ